MSHTVSCVRTVSLLIAALLLTACSDDPAPAPPAPSPSVQVSVGPQERAAATARLEAATAALRTEVDQLVAAATAASRGATTSTTEDERISCGEGAAFHRYTRTLQLPAPDSTPLAASLAERLEAAGWTRSVSPGRALQDNPIALRRGDLRITIAGSLAEPGARASLALRGDTVCVDPARPAPAS